MVFNNPNITNHSEIPEFNFWLSLADIILAKKERACLSLEWHPVFKLPNLMLL